ncbi:hypothetical protein POVWA2_056580 [Plasmodium ovale wallikeri]|uniref:Uncharacterized protein n=1 Tax=Plasmodium ovale wallikeri TaxID=864142 RepID=A0A1A8ZXU8_PLAOA|nr:hypothetical protein POVWA2_056580 [Plasmodium ovale wallikeri]
MIRAPPVGKKPTTSLCTWTYISIFLSLHHKYDTAAKLQTCKTAKRPSGRNVLGNMIDNVANDLYKAFCSYKTIHKINNFVYKNKEKLNSEEFKIINENKYASHAMAIITALASCSFLYLHTLYLSRENISRLIQLKQKQPDIKGICVFVDDMYKEHEPHDYVNLLNMENL